MVDFGSPRLGLRPLATEPFGSPPQDNYAPVPSMNSMNSVHSASPRMGAGVLQDGPEVARRAAEWERQIESLDQKEMEIHQTQLRLIREQTTTFRGDLLALQQELVDLKALVLKHQAMHGDLASRVDGRMSGSERSMKELNDTISKHQQLHAENDRKMAQLTGSIQDHHRALSHHATMKERMDYVERVLGDSADKHQRQLDEAHAKLEQLHGRLSSCEAGHSDLKKADSDRSIKHSSIAERVAYMEKLMGDSADKHARELQAIKDLHDKHIKDNHSRHSASEQSHASVQQRLSFLENAVGDSVDKHAKELELMKASMGKLSGGLREHATVAERLAFIEQAIGDSADKHQAELQQAHAKIDKMGGHADTIANLKNNHQNFAKDLATFSAHHASQAERIAYLEKVVGDSVEKHNRELETIKQAHNKLASESRGHSHNHGSVSDKVDAAMRSHATIEERLGYMEKTVGDSVEKHARELASLKAAHGTHASTAKEQMNKHASLEDRIEYLEKTIGDSADKHAAALAAHQAKIEHLTGKLSDEQKERMKHGGELNMHRDRNQQLHAAIEERIAFIEKTVGDSADKHRWELEQVKGAHAKLAGEGKDTKQKHSSLEERLNYIENWFRGFKVSA